MKLIFILLCAIFLCPICNAQFTEKENYEENVTLSENPKEEESILTKRIVPVGLITAGFLLSGSAFEKSLQEDLRNSIGNDFYTKYDDYFRYAPIVQIYTADLLGITAENHWFDQTKNLVLSMAIANGTSTLLKKQISKKRPGEGDNYNSFPSGHTTTAFATATVLYEEFKKSSPALAYSGFLFASATASLRMLNNAHYLSDVLAGAGLGILSTKLVYYFDELFDWNPFLNKNENLALAPAWIEGQLGFALALSL